MDMSHLDHVTRLHENPDVALDTFAAALAVKAINRLIAGGGSDYGHPESETVVVPQTITRFIERTMGRATYFTQEWQQLYKCMPRITATWLRGQELFQTDLAHAITEQEEYLFLKQEEAERSARAVATHLYWNDHALAQWTINGYMTAWREWCQASKVTTEITC